jgi:diguanylate cyclase (GGDEF)-like protein
MADARAEERPLPSGHPPTVLAIDDEHENLELMIRALRREYRVLGVDSGEAALERLHAPDAHFDVILADYRLPGMNGVELLSQAVQILPAARRVILTAYADMDVIIDAINRGRVHYFVKKPWDPGELCAVVASVLEFGRLESDNTRLVTELRTANDGLVRSEKLLAASLDERGRQLLSANEELAAANRELAVLAYRDGLTGLYNHRSIQERLREEIARARRYRKPLSIVFADLDHFKEYNDTLGHPKGDEALRLVARVLSGTMIGPGQSPPRESDIVARYGGEEFLLLLPETSCEGGHIRAERLREAIASTRFPGAEETKAGRLTMSFGVASFPDDARSPDELIVAADRALYAAKRQGRDRVCTASEVALDRDARDARDSSAPESGGRTANGGSRRRAEDAPLFGECMDEVAHSLQRAGALGCLYIDLGSLRRIELEHGSAALASVHDEAQALLRDPRRVRLRPGDLLCRHEGSEAFLLFLPEEPAGGGRHPDPSRARRGEDLEAVAERLGAWLDHSLGPRVQELLHDRPRVTVGRSRVLHNTLIRCERLVSQLVEEARESSGFERRLRQAREKRAVQDLILASGRASSPAPGAQTDQSREPGDTLTTHFQPIVHLPSASIFGYEALTRGPRRTELEAPYALFSSAEEVGLLFEVDRACFRMALRNARGVSPTHRLFLNLLPLSFYDETFIEHEVDRLVAQAGLTPANVVFEITERLAIENFGSFRRSLGRAISRGYGVAIDDVGTRHANLEAVIALRPNFIKLSDVLTRGVARQAAKREMIRSLATFAETIDAVLVAEGIEGPHDLAALMDVGVRYGQGFFLARPAPAWVDLKPATLRTVRALAEDRGLYSRAETSSLPSSQDHNSDLKRRARARK